MGVNDSYNFDQDAAERIVSATLAVEQMSSSNDPGPWVRHNKTPPKQGKLKTDLDAPEEFGVPETAELDVYVPDTNAPHKLIGADYTVVVTNRDPMFAAAKDDWIRVVFVNGEWQPDARGPCDYVEFQIDSADCEAKTCTVSILGRTCACSRVPGEYGSAKLDIVDRTCFFDQSTDDDLVSRKGYAKRLRVVDATCPNEKQTIRCSTNEIQDLSIESGTPSTGAFQLVFDDGTNPSETTADIAWNGTAADVKTALEALTIIDEVTCIDGPLPATAIRIEFTGAAVEKTNFALMSVTSSTLDSGTATLTAVQDGSASPTGGTFKLVFSDGDSTETTAALNHNCTAADVETALEALTIIDDVTCSGGPFPDDEILVEFSGGDVECQDFDLMTTADVSLAPSGTVIITETQAGDPAVKCEWVIVFLCPVLESC